MKMDFFGHRGKETIFVTYGWKGVRQTVTVRYKGVGVGRERGGGSKFCHKERYVTVERSLIINLISLYSGFFAYLEVIRQTKK